MFDFRSRSFWTYAIVILLFPVVVNFLLFQAKLPYVFGNEDNWLSFWGNYTGGLISAVVAYIVANSQIKKQLRLDLAKERYLKTINQLPALVRIKIEIEKFISELETVKKAREEFIEDNGGIRKKQDSFDEDFVGILELKHEGVPEFEVIEKHYYMELAEPESFSYLEKIEDIDLHINLITCFNFYKDFSDAMNYNMVLADKQREEVGEEIKSLLNTGQMTKITILYEQKGIMFRESTGYYAKKKNSWKSFYEEDMLSKFKDVLSRVNNEIEVIKQLKENGDFSLTEE